MYLTEDPKILGATVQNLVATITWHTDILHPCFSWSVVPLQMMYDVIYFYWYIFERRYLKCAVGKVTHQKHPSIADSSWIFYQSADKYLAQPSSQRILFDSENILFDASLVIYTGCPTS